MPSFNWDDVLDESGTVHENTANTDHTNASLLKQGFSGASPLFSSDLLRFYLLQEDSGTTIYDFSPNATNGTYIGAGPDDTGTVTGPLGVSAADFDGTDDKGDLGQVGSPTSFGILTFINPDTLGSQIRRITTKYTGSGSAAGEFVFDILSDQTVRFGVADSSGFNLVSSTGTLSTGSWQCVAGGFNDQTEQSVWLGTSQTTQAITYSNAANSTAWTLGADTTEGASADYLDGAMSAVAILSRYPTQSDVEAFRNAVKSPGDWLGTGALL